ncbi:MAG TPA: hypothetical protein VEK15_05020 [Vicinamibacteria bacterium]|nr:hypothetical protein [Vicinamibacteria bacterium]
MRSASPENEPVCTAARERWENEGGSAESVAKPASPERTAPILVAEPFPALQTGELVLKELELVRLVDQRTLGVYRVQPRGLGESGHVFLATLFGATCSKVEMVSGRKLDWHDYRAALKRAIEREIGYWQNRGEPLPRGAQRVVDVTVRDTDFAHTAVREIERELRQ